MRVRARDEGESEDEGDGCWCEGEGWGRRSPPHVWCWQFYFGHSVFRNFYFSTFLFFDIFMFRHFYFRSYFFRHFYFRPYCFRHFYFRYFTVDIFTFDIIQVIHGWVRVWLCPCFPTISFVLYFITLFTKSIDLNSSIALTDILWGNVSEW